MTGRRRPPSPTAGAPLTLPAPTGWARPRIAAGRALGVLPEYGSRSWAALADTDPRKLAAALVAAEAHRYEVATMADRLAAELDAARRLAAEDAQRAEAEQAETVAALTARSIDGAARRLVAGPCPPFADPTPVVDSPDWPTVAKPPAPERPSTAQMIRALADPA